MRWEKIVNELCGKLSAQHKSHIKPLLCQQATITNDVENVEKRAVKIDKPSHCRNLHFLLLRDRISA
jgi:hypothetical protein